MVPAQRPGLGRPPTPALTRAAVRLRSGYPGSTTSCPYTRRDAALSARICVVRRCPMIEGRATAAVTIRSEDLRLVYGDSMGTQEPGERRAAPCSAVQVLCGPGQACQRPGGMRLGLESCAVRAAAGGLAVDRRRLAGRDDDRSFPQTDRHRTAEPAPGHGVQARRRLAGPCHRGWSVLPGQQDLSARRRAEANPGGTSSKRLTTTSITRRRPPARRY